VRGPRLSHGGETGGPRYAKLQLGELALAPGAPCTADASGFDRHTFLCGQPGSGKTYSLGVILERLLIETDLRLVVLDPNSRRAAPLSHPWNPAWGLWGWGFGRGGAGPV
jgi:DNA helicase HerA-like ATPase